MKHKCIVIIVLLLVGLATGLYGQWMYSKDAVINQTPNAGTDYQVRFTLKYGVGTDSGETVYMAGKCKADYGDVRFFEGTDELDYWMEPIYGNSDGVFWVELKGNLDIGPSVVTIRYGNPSATTTANGENTFVFFDDFTGDLSKWTRHKVVGVYPQIADGVLRCGGGSTTAGTNTYGHTVLGSSATYSQFQDNALEFRFWPAGSTIGDVGIRGVFGTDQGYKGRCDTRISYVGNSILIHPYYYNSPPFLDWVSIGGAPAGWFPGGGWVRGTLTAYQSNLKLYRRDELTNSATDATYAGPGEISLQNHYGEYMDYDWVGVRKFAGTEPTRGAWGGEITLPVELTSFAAIVTAQNIISLAWSTASEASMIGYKVYYKPANSDDAITCLTPITIPAANSSNGSSYNYVATDICTPGVYSFYLEAISMDASSQMYGPVSATLSETNIPALPVSNNLSDAWPNPFKALANTNISVEMKAGEDGLVTIYNLAGQMVRVYPVTPGVNNLNWNGVDSKGNACASGVYFYKLTSPSLNQTKKLMLLK